VNSPRVTVVVLNYHGRIHLPGCLTHLAAQDFTEWELVLVDNSPEDNLINELETSEPLRTWLSNDKAKIIRNEKNLGFAKGVNQAINTAQGEYVLLLNQDAFMEPGYMSELVSVLDKNKLIASVTGKLLRMITRGGTDVIDSTGHEFYDDRIVINRGKDEPDKGQFNFAGEVFGVSAAAAMYRLSALKEVAYEGEVFDEDFFAYLEDIDMDFRLRRAGYIAAYTPDAVARHALAGSGGRKSFAIRFKAHTNRYKVIWKHDSLLLLLRDLNAVFRQEFFQFFRTLVTSPLLLLSFLIFPFKLPRILKRRAHLNRISKTPFSRIYTDWVRRDRLK